MYGSSDSFPFVALIEVLLGALGLSILLGALWFNENNQRYFLTASFLGVAVGFVVWSWIQLHVQPNYGTDEIAFNEYAARLLQKGQNPFQQSMAGAFDLFRVSPNGYTLRLDGTTVDQFSYPSLSFLVYLPLLLMGFHTQVGVAVNIILWLIVGIELFVLVPRSARFLAPIAFSIAAYTGFAVGGVTDPLYLVFLLPAVRHLYNYGSSNRLHRLSGPLGLGLALAVKQTPWVLAPFLVISLYQHSSLRLGTAKARKVVSHFCFLVAITALLPNVPFIIWDPQAWFEGVLTPMRGGLVPAGQGIVAVSNFLGVGGGDLKLIAFGSALLGVLLVLVQIAFPATVNRGFLVFPAIVLFFASRSYVTYLIMLIPAAMVARPPFGDEDKSLGQPSRTLKRCVLSIAVLVTLIFAKSMLTRPPLQIHIASVHTTGQLATVSEVRVTVTNTTNQELSPVYSVQSGGSLTIPWHNQNGQTSINPGQSVIVVLTSPNFPAQPRLTGGFQVVGLTTSPSALSVSNSYRPTNWHVAITPQAVNSKVQIGQPVVLSCQLLDEMNQPVKVLGVPIFMGQVTYAQTGLIFSQAIINSGGIGQTPIVKLSDRNGRADFVVRGTEASRDPVYFEANLINEDARFPYGYSEIVPIRFGIN